MSSIRAGILYFICVFGVGFVLGTIRVLLIVPLIGEVKAELAETPLMLLATVLVARWVVTKLPEPHTALKGLGVGFVALGFLLVAELGVVFLVRGQTISEHISSRDPVSGSVYLVSLMLFAAMPTVFISFRSRKPTN